MGKLILIVDDETDFSELLQFRLRDRQYEVLSAVRDYPATPRHSQYAHHHDQCGCQ